MRIIPPERKTIDGRIHICFRDVLHNLIVNNLQGNKINYNEFSEKIKRKSEKVLSPKHRKRIEKQVKKLGGVR